MNITNILLYWSSYAVRSYYAILHKYEFVIHNKGICDLYDTRGNIYDVINLENA